MIVMSIAAKESDRYLQLYQQIPMGTFQSSSPKLPTFPKQHWHEIPLPSNPHRRPSHCHYKLFRNVLTNEQIQQYSMTFQTTQEYQHYLQSFQWRLREQHLINTRYIDIEKDSQFCSTRQIAKVCVQHIPLRISNIQDIPEPQNLYVLMAALQGFQKIFRIIGYFRPNQDMIGIDRQGRVKVWLNSDFSKNYLYGPYYIQRVNDPLSNEEQLGEDEMVWDILKIIDQNTAKQSLYPLTIYQYLSKKEKKLTFSTAREQIREYSQLYHISIPNYFESILNIMEGDRYSQEDRKSQIISKVGELPKQKIIHYIDPAEITSQDNGSMVNLDFQSPPTVEFKDKTVAETQQNLPYFRVPKKRYDTAIQQLNNLMSKNQSPTMQSQQIAIVSQTVPKINFKYYSKDPNTQLNLLVHPNTANTNPPIEPHIFSNKNSQQYQFSLPIQSLNSDVKYILQPCRSNRLTYSDINLDYQLDEQLVQDMVKYLND